MHVTDLLTIICFFLFIPKKISNFGQNFNDYATDTIKRDTESHHFRW